MINAIKNVAIYPRKSRGEVDQDLEKHLLIMKEICEQHEWNYVEYPEIGSGESIADRVKIKELIKDVEEGMYDAVLVFDFDRLGRGSGTDQDTIRRLFKSTDTLIIQANPFEIYDYNDERDEETMDFKGFIARREYKMITKRLSTGRKIGLRMGRWSNGVAPFGYSYNAELKKLQPHPKESEIYKSLILNEFLNGKSTHDIAWNLNKKQIPSPRNGLWSPTTVNALLKSDVHLGHIVFNKTEGVRTSQTKSLDKKPFRVKPKEEWTTVKNCHTPLKTEEQHMRIMHLMGYKRSHSKGGNINSLSGLVKCYNCGNTLTIQKNEEGEMFFKKCTSCNECKGGNVQLAEDAIYESLIKIKKNLIRINNEQTNNEEKRILLEKIEMLENELDKNEGALEKIEEAFEEGMYTAEKAKKKMKVRQEKILELEDELKNYKKNLGSFSLVTNQERINKIENVVDFIKNGSSPEKMNAIYKSIISHIIWKKVDLSEVRVTVNFL
ncbi:recombinase family protein [Cytobacillus kochii]|uniref:recombinase family protein n=1 Tax=Cytobacillus kochii TaxID=859143 RepID=UPI001CD76ED9|nr:recombinase family protein [Cytobacillus kochii]MCA1027081.1 recombinase family protein [Cytobacillus kochii]